MGYVPVDQIKHGMILSEDVRDINSKLLLSKGQTITSKQIRILKIWGILEVNVAGNHGNAKIFEPDMRPEIISEINETTRQIFKHLDLNHPAVKEIFNFSVWYRSQHNILNTNENLNVSASDETISHLSKDIRIKIDKSEIKLPEIPTIINELTEIIDDPFASASDIARVVNKSPSLAALLLRIVNSAFYGFPSKIDSISRSVTLIGSKEVTGLALGISTMNIFKDIPKEIIDMHSFLKHSLACGILSRIFAAHKNLPQTEQLFVSGLLHDIGRLIVFKYFPDQAKVLLKHAKETDKPLFQIEKNHLGYSHTYIGKYLLQKWKLPPALADNVFFHHNPSKALDPTKATIVHLADIIVNGLGIGNSGESVIPYFDYQAWESLNISPRIFKVVIEQAVHQLPSLETFFSGTLA